MSLMAVGIAAPARRAASGWPQAVITQVQPAQPLPGIKKMFGPQALWEGVKALVKTPCWPPGCSPRPRRGAEADDGRAVAARLAARGGRGAVLG